jgi:hypothetical protein
MEERWRKDGDGDGDSLQVKEPPSEEGRMKTKPNESAYELQVQHQLHFLRIVFISVSSFS